MLCGGKGSRLLPITEKIPKPLFHIGDKPILWHIMKTYARYGHKDFVLLIGYKGDMIKDYFSKQENTEPDWNVSFIDTGLDTTKGDRLRMAKDHIKDDNFILAYADDLSDVDINKVIDMHMKNEKIVTITSVRVKSRFGILDLHENNEVKGFVEKPVLDQWMSAGYIVLNKRIFDFMQPGKNETDAFADLAPQGLVQAFKHMGFWKTMNNIQDGNELNDMWTSGELKKTLYPSES